MFHLHTLRHISYVYLQIFLTRQDNTSTIEAIFLYSVCGRVVQGTGHKDKRLVLQCINGVSSNPVEGRTTICQLKDPILTLFGLIFRRIYIYICIMGGFRYFIQGAIKKITVVLKSLRPPESIGRCHILRSPHLNTHFASPTICHFVQIIFIFVCSSRFLYRQLSIRLTVEQRLL